MKKKIPFLSLITILLSSATAIAVGATVFSLVNASFIINEESYFTITDSGHTYKCYTIQDHTVEVDNVEYPTVAIGWVLSDDNTIPTNLSVPETVSYNDTTYFVSAVAKAGFRYCSFTTISLPDSIEEIREEAFAYCEKMTSFAIPYQITEIAPSTFLDCRSLVNVTYKELDNDNNVVPSLGNKTITSIGDHAFDSCVSMTSFNFPDRLTFFGKSCFQNCSSLGTLDFPAATKNQNHQITNPLTIQSYAFADCSSLTYCYFEENLVAGSVSERAFTDFNSDLEFDFTGTSAQVSTFDSNNQDWRKKYITTSSSVDIPINPGADKKVKDNRYPGLSWIYKSGNIILDSRRETPLIDPLDSTGERYAEITGFITPTQNVPNYYTTNGALIIPNELPDPDNGENATVKVKTIAYKAFDQNTALTSVKFNKDLVSINHQAFWHCTGLLNLDFSLCEKLKEIGYSCFFGNSEDSDNTAYHSKVTSLQLPNCLEYIGDLAFANFFYCESLSFKTDNTKPSHLKVIGQYAFNRLGFKKTAGTINLVLPNTLNDQDAEKAKFIHPYKGSNNGDKSDVAIGRHCFDRAFSLLTLEMEKATDEQLWSDNAHTIVRKDYTCSVGTSAFNRTKYLIKFTASENLWTLGSACFNSNKIGDNNYVMP